MHSPFTIRNRHGDSIRGDVHVPDRSAGAPVLIICHGFKGFKDWGSFPHIADLFCDDGWIVVRFNFSLNGVGDDAWNFTELDRFERNTYSRELDDVSDIIDAVCSHSIVPQDAATGRLALLGHSRGGGIAIITAAEDARVRAVVSWAAVADFDRWGPELKRTWRERGRLEVMNQRTKQRMPLGVGLLEDYERNAGRLDITRAASRIAVPFLIVHGEQDVSVPVVEARRIHAAADPRYAELEIIPNTDHTFGAVHPFAGISPALDGVLQKTRFWLRVNTRPLL